MLAQTHQEEIPDEHYHKHIVNFITLNNIWTVVTEHKHLDIPTLSEIVHKLKKMFINLCEISLIFNRFTKAGFESLLDIKESLKYKINAKFGKYPGKKWIVLKVINWYVYFKTWESVIILKSKKWKLILWKKSKLFDSKDHIFIFTDPAALELSDFEIAEKDHDIYRTFQYYLNKSKQVNWNKNQYFFSIINKQFKYIHINNIFKRIIPNITRTDLIQITLDKNWNKYQIKWLLDNLSEIKNSTKIDLHLYWNCTKTLKILSSCLLKLTISKIELKYINQTKFKGKIVDCFLNQFLIKLISSPHLQEISLPSGVHLRNLDSKTKDELCQCLQSNDVQSLKVDEMTLPITNYLEIV